LAGGDATWILRDLLRKSRVEKSSIVASPATVELPTRPFAWIRVLKNSILTKSIPEK
jgi:hypothetical protein